MLDDSAPLYRDVPFVTGLVGTIRGAIFRGEWATKLLRKTVDGTPVVLEPEPSNTTDKNALRVLIYERDCGRWSFVGYVEKNIAKAIALNNPQQYRLLAKFKRTTDWASRPDCEVEVAGFTTRSNESLSEYIERWTERNVDNKNAFITKKPTRARGL